jgi:translation initiation factor 5A
MPDKVQIMDLETFEVFEAPKPEEPEFKDKLSPGNEVEYWRVLGKNKIMRIKG